MNYSMPNELCYFLDIQTGYTRFIIDDTSCNQHIIYNILDKLSYFDDSYMFFEMSFQEDLNELLDIIPCFESQKIHNKGKTFLRGLITAKMPFLILFGINKKTAYDFISNWSHVVYTNQCLCIYDKMKEQDIINILSNDKMNFEQRINLIQKMCHVLILNIPEASNDNSYDIICNHERIMQLSS